ncbi:hypothetical protein H6P81_015665 [Aristolochia fimbriata]|uniref:Bola-like protein n=1 Tax=Aristolochia fimbriata TaxID=158543 RepID=A0AAV7E898_ARIFI|nr:hypothetical protein H6P81_015665 [Aristolochia fimbriata]
MVNPLPFTSHRNIWMVGCYLEIIRTGFATERAMGVTKEEVEAVLTSQMKPTHLEVIDTSGGCGASFAIEIVSEQFEGKRLLERHRLVNAALAEQMKEIHALSIKKALTPVQWQQQAESITTPAQ